jgi:hypothetical protein
VSDVAGFSGLSMFDCPFGILYRLKIESSKTAASTVDHKMLNLVLIKVLGGWNFLSNQ